MPRAFNPSAMVQPASRYSQGVEVGANVRGGGLAGSGLIIVNPPWGLEAELKVIVQALATRLGIGTWGQGVVEWLTEAKG